MTMTTTIDSLDSEPIGVDGLLAACICAFCGTTVSGGVGFGGAVTFLAFAALARNFVHLPLRHAILLSIFRSAFTNPIMLYLGRVHLDLKLLRLLVPGILFGAPLGQLLLYLLPPSGVQSALGALCLFIVIERMGRLRAQRLHQSSLAHQTPSIEAVQASGTEERTTSLEGMHDDAEHELGNGSGAVAAKAALAEPRASMLPALGRTSAALLAGLASGTLGGSLGTSGIPLTIFAAYVSVARQASHGAHGAMPRTASHRTVNTAHAYAALHWPSRTSLGVALPHPHSRWRQRSAPARTADGAAALTVGQQRRAPPALRD